MTAYTRVQASPVTVPISPMASVKTVSTTISEIFSQIAKSLTRVSQSVLKMMYQSAPISDEKKTQGTTPSDSALVESCPIEYQIVSLQEEADRLSQILKTTWDLTDKDINVISTHIAIIEENITKLKLEVEMDRKEFCFLTNPNPYLAGIENSLKEYNINDVISKLQNEANRLSEISKKQETISAHITFIKEAIKVLEWRVNNPTLHKLMNSSS